MPRNHLAIFRAAALCAACLWVTSPVAAQAPPVAGQVLPSNSLTFQVQAAAERMEMTVNTSRIMQLPFKVPRVFVSNPDIVKATPLSPDQIQISALKPGVTQVNVWDEADHITTVDIVVYGDARELEMLLRSEFPDAQLKIRPLASSIYISGFVPKQEYVGQIVRMAEDYYPKVVNNLTVGGVQQILLNVRVMEVSRTKLRAMGVDWAAVNENFFLTQHTGGLINSLNGNTGTPAPLPIGSTGDTVRFGIIGDTSFFGFLELLRQNDLAKLLAEPKLTTVSGRAASFNVGGQVPIPIAQSLGTVTVQYKDFGTQIDFVPIALGNGNIRLEVRPDITEVDPSLRDATTGVPGFRRRYADTAVELQAGQTMAIAGLIYQRTDASNRGVPWLADLPWVGAAFRRTRETVNEVELVITVTPEFVGGMDCEQVPNAGPGQMTTTPTDVELYGRGYIEVPRCNNDGGPFCQPQQLLSAPGQETLGPPLPASVPYQGAKTSVPMPVRKTTSNVPQQRRYTAPADAVGENPIVTPRSIRPTGTTASPVSTRSVPSSRSVMTSPTKPSSTTRLPAVPGTTRSLPKPDPVQASLSDEPELIGPLGYDRLK
jgi:pilus assembly protein CpaC